MILSGFSGVTRTQSNNNQEGQKLEKISKKKINSPAKTNPNHKIGKQTNNKYILKNICRQIQDSG